MNRVGSLFLLRFFVISGRRVDSSYPDLLSLLKVLRKRKSYQNRFTFIQTHTLSSETITIIDTKFGGKFESGKWDTHTCSVVLLSDLHKTLKKPNFGNRTANDTEKEMKGTDERESFNLVTRSGFRSRQHSAEITRFTVWKASRSGSWPHLQQLSESMPIVSAESYYDLWWLRRQWHQEPGPTLQVTVSELTKIFFFVIRLHQESTVTSARNHEEHLNNTMLCTNGNFRCRNILLV